MTSCIVFCMQPMYYALQFIQCEGKPLSAPSTQSSQRLLHIICFLELISLVLRNLVLHVHVAVTIAETLLVLVNC